MSLETITYQKEEAMVAAQCLISMATNNKDTQAPPRRCDGGDEPSSVSLSEEENDLVSSLSCSVSHEQYSCDNMVSTADLPNPSEWGRKKYSPEAQW